MARRSTKSPPTLGLDVSLDDDSELDQTNFQRPGYSPKEHQTTLKSRIRRSFTSSKDKYKHKYNVLSDKYEAKTKECEQYKEEFRDLQAKLVEVANSSPYHISGLQVGDNNTMINVVDTDALTINLDEALEEVEILISKQTRAIDSLVEEKAKAELQLEDQKLMLTEIQEKLSSSNNKHDEKNKKDTKHFQELRSLLLDIKGVQSDQQVLTTCIDGLKKYVNNEKKTVSEFQGLPAQTQPGITRLVNKFGHQMSWKELANRFDLSTASIEWLSKEATGSALTKDTCVKVMVEWIKDPTRDAKLMMEQLALIDKEKTEDVKKDFAKSVLTLKRQRKAYRRDGSSVHSDQKSTNSIDSSTTQRGLKFGYSSQQLERTVELCGHVLNKVNTIDAKLDTLCASNAYDEKEDIRSRDGDGIDSMTTEEKFV